MLLQSIRSLKFQIQFDTEIASIICGKYCFQQGFYRQYIHPCKSENKHT